MTTARRRDGTVGNRRHSEIAEAQLNVVVVARPSCAARNARTSRSFITVIVNDVRFISGIAIVAGRNAIAIAGAVVERRIGIDRIGENAGRIEIVIVNAIEIEIETDRERMSANVETRAEPSPNERIVTIAAGIAIGEHSQSSFLIRLPFIQGASS